MGYSCFRPEKDLVEGFCGRVWQKECRCGMNIIDKALRNWKLHLLVLVFTVLAETVGVRTVKLGPGMLVLIPLLYSFVLGALCGLPFLKVLKRSDMFEASSLVGVSFFLLMARYGTSILWRLAGRRAPRCSY